MSSHQQEEAAVKRRTARKNREQDHIEKEERRFGLVNIKPATENQAKAFRAWEEGQHLMLSGVAGSGKSFSALFLGLKEIERGNQDRVVIVRSAVPTKDIGFLPGNVQEKTKVYEAPFISICSELYDRGDAYGILKQKKYIDFITTSYIRGITLNDCIIVVDESQNLSLHELSSVITRVGKNCRIIFMGDYFQGDLQRKSERQGLLDFTRIIKRMGSFSFVEFGFEDILRSDVVKEYLIAQHELQLDG